MTVQALSKPGKKDRRHDFFTNNLKTFSNKKLSRNISFGIAVSNNILLRN